MHGGDLSAKARDGGARLFQLLRRTGGFHGKKCAATAHKRQAQLRQYRQFRHGAGNTDVKAFTKRTFSRFLRAGGNSGQILQFQQLCGLRNVTNTLFGAVKGGDGKIRAANGKRKAGKARATADINHFCVFRQKISHRERICQVLEDNCLFFFDGGQIHHFGDFYQMFCQ